MRRALAPTIAFTTLLSAVSFVHCGGQVKSTPANEGELQGPCYPDGTCNTGTTCVSNECVIPDTDANVDPFPEIDAEVPDYDAGYYPYDSGGLPSTLYDRLGQHAGIAALIKETIEAPNGELADPQIASYFFIRTGGFGGASGGAPSAAIVEDCFTGFLGRATGGPEVYPFVSNAGGASFMCRDMASAHAGLGVTNAAFQKFVTILAAKFTAAGVSQSDLQTVGGAILGTASDVIDRGRTQAQQEAGGFDAATSATNYGAACSAIVGGAATAPGCVNP